MMSPKELLKCCYQFGFGLPLAQQLCNCGPLVSPENGAVDTSSGSTLGREAVYSCKPGYDLTGSSIVVCLSTSHWSDNPPVCVVKDCGPLLSPDNGAVDISSGTIVGKEAVYSCNPGYDLSGSSIVVCLSTGHWSDKPPVCIIKDCGPLPALDHGSVDTADGDGLTARYSCNFGYYLMGNQTLLCTSAGEWAGSPPSCTIYDCGPLNNPLNGVVNAPVTTFNAEATYECNTGYILEGSGVRRCMNGGVWSGNDPICVFTDCGPLYNPLNGVVNASVTTFNSEAVYECNTGYMLEGSGVRRCQNNGIWSGSEPTCVIIDCGSLQNPENGKVDTSPGTHYMDTAAYTCSDGYLLVGTNTRLCQSNGSWEGIAPACVKRDCGSNILISDGSVDFPDGTRYQSRAVYSCHPGYHLVGDATRTCTADGTWSGVAPACLQDECVPLSPPQGGSVSITIGTTGEEVATYRCNEGFVMSGSDTRWCSNGIWTGRAPDCLPFVCGPLAIPFGDVSVEGSGYGSTASITCHQGYRIVGPSTVICLGDRWSNVPSCRIADCGDLPAPAHGHVNTAAGTTFGQTATYSCDFGFRLIGDSTRYCTSLGSWDGTQPFCRATGCGSLPNPQFGSVTVSGITLNATATYSCFEGYRLNGISRRICGKSGEWSGLPPTCKIVDCGSLNHPVNGTVDTTPGTTYKKTAAYTCMAGFTLTGTNLRICEGNGQWSKAAPICVIKDCGPLPHPLNGEVITSSGTTFRQFATYRCYPGYSVSGARIRACLDTGLWSGLPPTCAMNDCGPLKNPQNGQVNTSGTTFGRTADFTCDPGYRLMGEATLVCRSDGQWSDSPPACQLIDCGTPLEPLNGHVSVSDGTLLAAVIQYNCDLGYTRKGPSVRICTKLGVWSGQEPKCKLTDCGTPPSPPHGSVVVTGTTYREKATFECDRGYNMMGASETECLASGRWGGTFPTCNIVDCGSVPTPVRGVQEVKFTTYGSKIEFSCLPGFQLRGFDTLICTETGEWSQKPPTCETIDCGRLTKPANGAVNTSESTTLGSLASYSCLPGYKLIGQRNRACGIDGNWIGTQPACQPKDCGSPTRPKKGFVDVSSGTIFGKTARYSCEKGFFVDGLSERLCAEDGHWAGSTPVCKHYDCGSIPDPANGMISAKSGTTVGKTVQFSCNLGYDLIGVETIICEDDGRWSDSAPLCVLTDCGGLISPGNGSVSTGEQTTTFGQVATYACNPGYILVGNRNRICQQNGSWSGSPAACEVKDCGPLPSPIFGSLSLPWGTTYNQRAIYSCDVEGYYLSGPKIRICQENGTWSDRNPVCKIYDCGTPERPMNGSANVPQSTIHGAIATFYCNYGYRLTGSDTRVCVDGSWTGFQPVCLVQDCGRLRKPSHGIVSVDGTTHNSTALYTCLAGYDIQGNYNRTCLGNGSWSDVPPTCRPKDCGDLEPPVNGAVATPAGTTFGKKAKYTCSKGYYLVGIDSRVCESKGTWRSTPPTCKLHDCGSLSSPENGKVDLPNGTTYGQIATYSCFKGYEVLGEITVTCTENGTWSNTTTCIVIDCGYLRSLKFGKVDITQGTTYTKVATYSCNTGYRLRGGSTRICQASGQWSLSQSYCDIVDCGGLSHPSNGVVSFPFGTTYGENVIYTCDPGYQLVGNDTRICTETGVWSGIAPRCGIKVCGVLEAPAHGSVAVTGITYGDVATYSCDKSFEISGVINRQCLSDGQWSAAEPICVLKADLKAISLSLSLNVTVDLSDPSVYKGYKSMAKDMLTDYYKKEMGTNIKDILINSLWEGSLNIAFEAIILDTEQSAQQFGEATKSLLYTQLGEIDNQTAVSHTMTFDGSVVDLGTVSPDFLTCLSYAAAKPCDLGNICILKNSTPACVPDPATECGPLESPRNGLVDISEGTTYGKLVTYTCKPGYSLLGYATRSCQADGSWTGSAPSCSAIDCGTAISPVDGTFSVPTRTTVGHTVTYQCNHGYSMIGQSEATCLATGNWSSPSPICVPTGCEAIQSPVSGVLSIENTTFGMMATYRCLEGYTLIGSRTRVCKVGTGVWTGSGPVCTIKDCGPLSNPNGGIVDLTGGTTYGSVATYTCNERGYVVLGGNTRLCGVSGYWSGTDPTCVPQNCGSLSSPLGGSLALSGGTTIGSIATFSCGAGFKRSGPATLVCNVNGRWSDEPPTCIPTVNCPALSDPTLGRVVVSGYYQGAIATYTCNRGYRLIGNQTRICLSSESWSSAPPVCEIQDCGTPSVPSEGSVNVSGTTFGNLATYSCKSGYGLVGSEKVLCQDTGIWSDTTPKCVLNCPNLRSPKNGKIDLLGDGLVTLIATFSCNPGYDLVGGHQSICQGGSWAGVTPFCIAKDCGPLPTVSNGKVGFYTSTTYGQAVTYTCSDGYVLEGSNPVVCLENSTWSQAPSCILVDCGPLTLQVNGTVVAPSGTLYGHTAMYSCNLGLQRVGPAVVTCLSTGHWSHNITCEVIDCGHLIDPTNGHVNISSGTTYNNKAIYFCNQGYILTGSNTRICTSVGWSGMAPICALIDCGKLEIIANGTVTTSRGTTYNQVATYTCNYGYALIGKNTRICLASGRWSDEQPSCRYFDCGPLESPQDGSVNTLAGTSYGNVAMYTCNVGYYLNGNKRRQCLDTGSWSGTPPTCQIHDCGSLRKPSNGEVTYSRTTYAAEATYKCDTSYNIVGDSFRTCNRDGKWTGIEPRCDSRRDIALALGLSLGLGAFLIIVMAIIMILFLMYSRRYKRHRHHSKRRLLYYNSPEPGLVPSTRYYSAHYLPDKTSTNARRNDRRKKTTLSPLSSHDNKRDTSHAQIVKLGRQDYVVQDGKNQESYI